MHHNKSDDGSNVSLAQQNSQQQQRQQKRHNELFWRNGDTSSGMGDVSHIPPRTLYSASPPSSQGVAWMEGRRYTATPSGMAPPMVSPRVPFTRTVLTAGRHSPPESQRSHHHFQRGHVSHHMRGRNDVRVQAPSSSSMRIHSMLPERRSGSHGPSQQRRHHHHHYYYYYQYYHQQLEEAHASQGHQSHHPLVFASPSSLCSAAVHSPLTMPLSHATTHGSSGESSHLSVLHRSSNINRASPRQHMIIPSSHDLLRHPQRQEPPLVCGGGPVPMGHHANVHSSHNDRHPPQGPHHEIHQSQHPHRDQRVQSPESPSQRPRSSSGSPIMTIDSTVLHAERQSPHASRRTLLKDSPQVEINILRSSDECPFVSSPLTQSYQNDERSTGEHVGYLIPPQTLGVVGLPTCCLDLDDTLVHTFGERPKWWDPSRHPGHFEIEVEVRKEEDLVMNRTISDGDYTGGIDAHCFDHHSAVYPPEQQGQTQMEMLHCCAECPRFYITTRERLYVCLRPYVESLLEVCFKHFEVVFFTTGTEEYARQVFDVLDPDRRAHRLYRHHCTRVGARSYMKDLSRLGRPLHRVLLFDDRGPDVSYQRRNVLPCDPFVDEREDDPYDRVMNDNEMLGYARFLETLARLPHERMLEAVQDYKDVMDAQMSARLRMLNEGRGAQTQVIPTPEII